MNHSSEQLQILRASMEQIDLIVPLFDGYRQFYGQPSDLALGRRFVYERLERADSVLFLALREGAGVGFTQLYPSFSSVAMQRLWILNDLFVAPTARGQGVATALLERARDFAIETQAKGLVLETAPDNPAQKLYERLGWQRDEQFYHYVLNV